MIGLSISACSPKPERTFSFTTWSLTKQRNCMSAKSIEELAVVNDMAMQPTFTFLLIQDLLTKWLALDGNQKLLLDCVDDADSDGYEEVQVAE